MYKVKYFSSFHFHQVSIDIFTVHIETQQNIHIYIYIKRKRVGVVVFSFLLERLIMSNQMSIDYTCIYRMLSLFYYKKMSTE